MTAKTFVLAFPARFHLGRLPNKKHTSNSHELSVCGKLVLDRAQCNQESISRCFPNIIG